MKIVIMGELFSSNLGEPLLFDCIAKLIKNQIAADNMPSELIMGGGYRVL